MMSDDRGTNAILRKSCCAPVREDLLAPVANPEMSPNSAIPSTEGMIRLPGGPFLMGTDDKDAFPGDGEGPVREVTLDSFWIDKFPVANRVFANFVQETAYVTDAERFGWSFVFWAHLPKNNLPKMVANTVAGATWWCKVPGACWKSPEGPGSSVQQRDSHPVVHVSWNDAARFSEWSGRRLPSEAEWEYAARGGLVQKVYPWGDKLRPNGKHLCNIWQGVFPLEDTGEDGYTGTCPVDAFAPNGYGLYSTTGNTWEWCADWFSDSYHLTGPRLNPQGPPEGHARVIKGGSFLCHKSYCNRYRVAARSSNTPDSSTSHMGFRCALSTP